MHPHVRQAIAEAHIAELRRFADERRQRFVLDRFVVR
jgi:hypothetical protein